MSLVEKALQKLQAQQSRPAEPITAQRVQGETATAPIAVSTPSREATQPIARHFEPRGTINFDINALRAAGLLPTVEQERTVQRQLRAVKLGLLRKMVIDTPPSQDVLRTIMVTSGLPGDGKTSTSLNLAMSLALEKDLNVLLVDADVLKPHITTILGLNGQRGLIDVLSEPDADAAEIVRGTSVRGLYFAPAGRNSEVATELLSSGRMINVVQQLAGLQSNWLVVFDTPPMLVTSEAQALAALMSQILVVVRSGSTPQTVVKQTLEQLAGTPGNVSLLLNDARNSDLSAYAYGYGHDFSGVQK